MKFAVLIIVIIVVIIFFRFVSVINKKNNLVKDKDKDKEKVVDLEKDPKTNEYKPKE